MPIMSGGEAFVRSLVGEGVDTVFGIPGIHLSGIVAAIRDEPRIRLITTRHESAAAHMADGYARTTGKPGVVMTVPGAAAYNVAAGLTTPFARSVPVLAVAAEIPREQIGKRLGTFHEIWDQGAALDPVTKWRRTVLTPREVPGAVTEAFRQMRTGRPRPVLIQVPPEVGVERDDVELCEPAPVERIAPGPQELAQAAELVARSSTPVIYAGSGVGLAKAEAALLELVDLTKIPVITSAGGKGCLPDDHPLCYGSCLSPRAERHEMNELHGVLQASDLVIGIGARFSLGNPAGDAAPLININIDPSEVGRIQANTLPLHGDARATLEAWIPHLKAAAAGDRPSPAAAVVAARRLIDYYDIRFKEPQYPILRALNQTIPPETIICWDVTQFGYYARTHYRVTVPGTYLDSGYSFNLGFAFPTAIGVKVARPDRPVVAISGDGGFMFNASELSTAVQYGINVVAVIFRNDSYGNVATDLDELFDGTYGTDLQNPDLVKFAESFGAVGLRVQDPAELAPAVLSALQAEAPVVIDVPIAETPLTRAHFMATLPNLPWTHPQEGLIGP